ncbi:MAG: hypothetical protein M1813_000077 [Trichoglossum hirsutum]|nr:MAG: hypothetical protein M1813_000077 [Trichoglossum hirsutum]
MLWGVTAHVNPFRNQLNGQPAAILRCTVKGFKKFVMQCANERRQADRLEKVYSICVLKRNYASRIPFDNETTIGADIPPMQVRTVELKFTADELKRYTPMHNIALSNLTKVLDDGSSKMRVVFDMRVWRSLTHFSTWLGLEHCLHIKADILEEHRSRGVDIQDLVLSICADNPSISEPQDSILGILKWVASSSPKLRYFSYLVAEVCIKQKEKLLVWVGAPLEQKLLEDFLLPFHIDVQSIHSGMSTKRRQVVVDLFHNDENSPAVLICTYLINSFWVESPWKLSEYSPIFTSAKPAGGTASNWEDPQNWPEVSAEDMSNTMSTTGDNNSEEVVDIDKFTSVRRFILVDNVLEFGDESTESPLAPEDIAKEIAKVLSGQGSIRKKIRRAIVANDTDQDVE